MFLLMVIAFFTSRVVLDKLGIEDYGIYNVVAGFTVFFGFFSSSLTNATQRFLTVALGHNDLDEGNKVFNLHFFVYGLVCLAVIFVGEAIGPWFISNKLTIPIERVAAAQWVFQFSLITLCFSLIGIVFNSVLIAHENMKVYSVFGIVDGMIRLVIAYLLALVPMDRLVFYGLSVALLSCGIQVAYLVYCFRNYEECYFRFYWDKGLIKETASFISWNTLSTAIVALNDQGVSILMNIFFGPIINAARGVTAQVSGAVFRFSSNFMISVQPQIVKSYANRDFAYLYRLFYHSSCYSYYLLLVFSIPVVIYCPEILSLWLKEVPEWTVVFIRLSLISALPSILKNPIWFIVIAVGKLKKFIIVSSLVQMAYFPLSYLLLTFGFSPFSVYMLSLIVAIVNLIAQLIVLKRYIDYSYREYYTKVIRPILCTTIFTFIFSLLICYCYTPSDFVTLVAMCVLIVIFTLVSVWIVGMSKKEKEGVVSLVKLKILNHM